MDASEFDFRSFFGVIRRQAKLVGLTIALVLGLTVLALSTLTPIYSATALVLIDTSGRAILDNTAQAISTVDSARVESEVELLRADSILLDVVARENLVDDEEFGPKPGRLAQLLSWLGWRPVPEVGSADAVNQTLGKLRQNYTVQRRGLTYLIAISVRSEDPAKAARLANTVASSYIDAQIASREQSHSAAGAILAQRAAQARTDMLVAQSAIDSYIADNWQRLTLGDGSPELIALQAQIEANTQSANQTREKIGIISADLASDDLAKAAEHLGDEALVTLASQRADAEDDAGLRTQIMARLDVLQQSLVLDEERAEGLRASLHRQIVSSDVASANPTDLYELQQRAAIARDQYQVLLLRSQDATMQASSQLADSRIVSEALPPGAPSFPNTTTVLLLATAIALVLGLATAFLYENIIGGFTTEEQMEAVLRIPVAGSIPRERPTDKESLADILINDPLSTFAECIRRVRAVVQQAVSQRQQLGTSPVIMVTSAAPNEGKTTLALGLARSYALAGQKTILIDCDLRKPSVHRQLDLQPSHGLVEYLNNQLSVDHLKNITASPNLENLTVVLGTRRSDLPTDQLLTGDRFPGLIRAARASFDVVILDTPPVAPVVDGLYIAPYADVIVFATKWASTPQRDAKKSLANLENAVRSDGAIISVLTQRDDVASSYRVKYGEYYRDN